jgi:hypothetical protein
VWLSADYNKHLVLSIHILSHDRSTPFPMRVLYSVRSSSSSFNLQNPLVSLRSYSSYLRLLPRLPVTSLLPSLTFSKVIQKTLPYASYNQSSYLILFYTGCGIHLFPSWLRVKIFSFLARWGLTDLVRPFPAPRFETSQVFCYKVNYSCVFQYDRVDFCLCFEYGYSKNFVLTRILCSIGKIIVLWFNLDAVMPVNCILECARVYVYVYVYVYEGFKGIRYRSLRDYELSSGLLWMNKQLLTTESVWHSLRKWRFVEC